MAGVTAREASGTFFDLVKRAAGRDVVGITRNPLPRPALAASWTHCPNA